MRCLPLFEYTFSTRYTRPVNMKAGAKMTFFQIYQRTTEGRRLAVQKRLTIGGIQISEGLRLVGFEFEARRGDAISGDVITGDHPADDPPQMINGRCINATSIYQLSLVHKYCNCK